MFYKKLLGENIYLSPMDPKEYKQYTEWLNTPRVSIGMGFFSTIFTEETEKEKIEEMSKTQKVFAIVKVDDDKLIGNIGLFDFKDNDRNCEVGLFIGDEENRNKGYGKEAVVLMLDYAFNYLNMHSVRLNVFSFNKLAINSYLKIGFKQVGIFREHKYIMGKYYDQIMMDILKDEFVNSEYGNFTKMNLYDIER